MIIIFPKDILEIEKEVNLYKKWDGIRPYIPDDAPDDIKRKYKILVEYISKATQEVSEI